MSIRRKKNKDHSLTIIIKTMANLRSKIYFILLAVLLSVSSFTYSQSVNDDAPNPVITQGIESAKTGIEYWNSEAEANIKNHVGVYCDNECTSLYNSINATSNREVKKWTAELSHQLKLAKDLAEKNASLNSVNKYLKFAYKTLAALKVLYADLKLPELKILITGLETAIKVAEKLISIFK